MIDVDLISRFAAARPEKIAVRKGATVVDRATLSRRIGALAERLADTPPESLVGIQIGNDPAFVVGFIACLVARRPIVALDPLWSASQTAAAAQQLPLSILLHTGTDPELCPSAWQLDAGGDLLSASNGGPPENGTSLPGETAVVHWSSGSTGTPKPMVVSRNALAFRYMSLIDGFALTEDDRMLCLVPLTHSHGIDAILSPTFASGAELILLEPMAATPMRVAEEIATWGVTAFSAFPRLYEDLLRTDLERDSLRTVRLSLCGSAALAPEVATAFKDRFGKEIVTGYGLTEIGVVCMDREDRPLTRPGSVGRFMPGVEWRLEGAEAESGELWVRSPGCAEAYLDDDKGRRLLEDGWLGTQDLVRVDDDGYVYILGRISRFINVDGAKVDPREIERVIESLPWVEEAAVVGTAKEGGNEQIVAFVVIHETVDDATLQEGVRRRVAESLSFHKVPAQVFRTDALPKNSLGKILYAELEIPQREGGESAAPPESDVEQRIANLWSEVLSLDRIGRRQHFAALGGTSLQLVQLHELLSRHFDHDLSVVDLFRYPTVETQATLFDGKPRTSTLSDARQKAVRQRAQLLKGKRRS